MRPSLVLLCSLSLAVACDPGAPGPSEAPDLSPGATALSPPTSAWDLQRFPDRAVWFAPSRSECTGVVNGWTRTPLFEHAHSGLGRYCLLTDLTGAAGALPAAGLVTEDRLAIATLSGAPSSFEEATYEQVDTIASFSAEPTLKARLTLLDTVPTSTTPVSQLSFDQHGRRLAAMAEAFTTDDSGTSLVDLESQLAISWIATKAPGGPVFSQPTTGSGKLKGGSVGSLADLAAAIVTAVDDWKDDQASNPTTVGPLVLNLSLGWHPVTDGNASRSPAEQAVYAALEYASCNDVLVIAAAGHEDTPVSGPGRTGARYPAAWEQDAQPSGSRCTSDFGGVDREPTSSSNTYRPLLYAAGAVDTAHLPIPITRPGGLPRLVAPGQHLSVTPSGHTTATNPTSGTSVGTLVSSSAAALVRTVRPDLSAHDAMDMVYQSGTPSTGSPDADFQHGTTAQPVHVVGLCAAVEEACTDAPSKCKADTDSQVCASGPVDPYERVLPASPSPSFDLYGSNPALEFEDICVGSHLYRWYNNREFPDYNCPIQQKNAAASIAVVQPMPPDDYCPPCIVGFGPGGIGTADLDMLGPVHDLENPGLTVHFATANHVMHYPLAELETQPMTVQHIYVNLPGGTGEHFDGVQTHQATGVTLDYLYQGFSYSEPLHVQWQ